MGLLNRVDVEHVSAWVMEGYGHRFYFQNLIDLRAEPRWLPDYVSPAHLKQEMLGRLYNAAGSVMGCLPKGPLYDTLNPTQPDSGFNQARNITSSFPGPLEGSDLSLLNPIPEEIEGILDQALSGDKLTAESIITLMNTTGLFRVDSDKAEKVVDAIKESNFRFSENYSEVERFSFVRGLAEVACRLRNENLARSVRALARSHKEDLSDDRRHFNEVVICLISAGAFEDFDSWSSYVSEWVNELCLQTEAKLAGDLATTVEVICLIEPRLRSKLGVGLAALASVH